MISSEESTPHNKLSNYKEDNIKTLAKVAEDLISNIESFEDIAELVVPSITCPVYISLNFSKPKGMHYYRSFAFLPLDANDSIFTWIKHEYED